MAPTWDPPGADRTQVGPMWATWTCYLGQFTCLSMVCLTVYWSWHQRKQPTKLPITSLCKGNPPVTGGFSSQRASNVKTFICHDVLTECSLYNMTCIQHISLFIQNMPPLCLHLCTGTKAFHEPMLTYYRLNFEEHYFICLLCSAKIWFLTTPRKKVTKMTHHFDEPCKKNP